MATATSTGRISQVIGSTFDAEFSEAAMPAIYNAVKVVIDTTLSPHQTCLYMLIAHTVVGVIGAWIGCHRHQWD